MMDSGEDSERVCGAVRCSGCIRCACKAGWAWSVRGSDEAMELGCFGEMKTV
jgi:hypothetical protein